jgi:hypothetical protein
MGEGFTAAGAVNMFDAGYECRLEDDDGVFLSMRPIGASSVPSAHWMGAS